MTNKLDLGNGVIVSRVWNASGARGFFTEGYWFHRLWRPFGLDYRGSTFVAKTTTFSPRRGNMPLRGITPREWKPRCIAVNFRRGAVLNAVGLSGPGVAALLEDGRWQARMEPFLLSFMAVASDRTARLLEAEKFAWELAGARRRFQAPFGLQVNLSCPNVGLDPSGLVREARDILSLLSDILPGVPLVPKFNVLVPPVAALDVAAHPACKAVVVSNTIPWGWLPDRIDWRGLFGETSPLAEFGGGGLSGAPLLPLVWEWLDQARRLRFPVPLIAGGGVLSADDAGYLFSAGAAAVEIGSVAILRPWRVRSIIRSCTG